MAFRTTPPIALTIAGHDPSSGAGVTADLQVLAAHGIFGTSCITALTAQSTMGVKETVPVSSDFLKQCLDLLAQDVPPTGVKIGMLASAGVVRVVGDFLETLPRKVPLVLDPVLRSSSGKELLSMEGIALLRKRLLPVVHWITPNREELATLLGQNSYETPEDVLVAVTNLQADFPHLGVIVTGGDVNPPADLLRLPTGESHWIVGEHITSTATHGTGCAFSTSFLCNLLHGQAPFDAARASKSFVEQAIRSASTIGRGKGPMNLLWPLLRDTTKEK